MRVDKTLLKKLDVLKYLNYVSLLLVTYIIFNFIYMSFELNSYEMLTVDERIAINDIYNVWILDNEFNRYPNIDNEFLKNLVLVLTELAYGGDLRYGRLWSNLYIVLIGPFSLFFSDQTVITLTRLLTLLIYFLSVNIFINLLLNKKYRWIYLLIFYCLPGIYYYNTIAKPDQLVLLLIGLSIKYFKDEKYYLTIFFLALTTGVKIIGIFGLIPGIIFIFINKKIKFKFKNVLKMILLTWAGIIVVNPILLIPPINRLGIPNFYSIYYNWLDSQTQYSQPNRYDINYFTDWSETLTIHFSMNLTKSPLFFYFILSLMFLLFLNSLKNFDNLYSYIYVVGFLHFIFILFSIQRQWILYLNFSLILMVVSIIYLIQKNKSIPLLLVFLFIVPNGFMKLTGTFEARNTLPTGDSYAIPLVIEEIESSYRLVDAPNNIVYWDTELGMPRNKVTYKSFFFVRENWAGHDLDAIFVDGDMYVTKRLLEDTKYTLIEVKDFKIYLDSKSD